MSLWTLVKIFAALCVMAVMALTAMLAYHVTIAPLGGVFEKIIPDPVRIVPGQSDDELAKMLESPEMPDINPGEKAFQKAHELLALGRIPEAREKLTAIVNVFPGSSTAPTARRIVGEINLDEILAASHMEGKQIHVVKRGESLLGIAAKYNTTIDCIMHLNSMMEMPRIQPGDELVVMPLDFRLLIEPRRKSVSLWQGGRFVREYPVLHFDASATQPRRAVINSKAAELDGRRVLPQSKEYRAAEKVILIDKPALQIRSWDGGEEKPAGGILLRPEDMEEIALLTRTGNEVEIR
ncbi:MAG: LysM domain-containing protein [Verrucomicrobiaceae bacterium]|nr:MAG: LysM domain-containing protein [Verrucomicrobiaceae bacterium]